MLRTYVRKQSDSIEELYDDDVISDVADNNLTFGQALTFEEVVKRFKEGEEEKLNRELNMRGMNMLFRRISVEVLQRKSQLGGKTK